MTDVDTNQPYIVQVHNGFSSSECQTLIDRIESLDPKVATINTPAGTRVNRDIRNNDRVIFEDEALAKTVLERILDKSPRQIHGHTLVCINERFRCYRYLPGMKFAPHADGAFHRDDREQSFYSVLIYLNSDMKGGATTFLTEPEVAIRPETGKILLFQHPILHEGSVVTEGVKYVARTDLMYRKDST